jgi:hypothetical protein
VGHKFPNDEKISEYFMTYEARFTHRHITEARGAVGSSLIGGLKPGDEQPRSQGFSLFVIGKAGKGPGTGRFLCSLIGQ